MLETVFIIFLGLLAGMVVNYLSDVLPIHRRPTRPICLHCGKEYPGLVHYALWPRRCPHCAKRRGLRTWIVEILFAGLFYWLWAFPEGQTNLPFWAGALLLLYFGIVVVIDMEYRLILHPVSWFGAFMGFAYGYFMNGFWATLWGGIAGYGVMLALYFFGVFFVRIVRRIRGDMEEVALGYGDVNLTGVLGLILGFPNILVALMLSVLIAGVISLFLVLGMALLRRYRAFLAIPYGPFLVLGASLILFGPTLAQEILARAGPLFAFGQ